MSSSLLEKNEKRAHVRALLRSLRAAGVKFLRYTAVDQCNTLRLKVMPLDVLQKTCVLENQVVIAQVVFGGLPSFADYAQEASGLDPTGFLRLVPDMNSLRILPYAPKSASVVCNLQNPVTNEPSELCCRSLLQKIVDDARRTHNIAFAVGAELEFVLYDAADKQPVDQTTFATSRLLNEQEPFLGELYDTLTAQEIEVEQLHAESAPGQVELVLRYTHNPVEMADRLTLARETVSSLAKSQGMLAVWLPKVFATAAGNGNHLHLSVSNATTGQNLFPADGSDNHDAGQSQGISVPLGTRSVQDISAIGQAFMEGILQHLPSLLGLTLPTTNSFRRIGPGCWTGSSISWAFDDKESPLRVAANVETGSWEHVEYKLMDSTANPYLALAAILAAGAQGIANKFDLRPYASRVAGDFPASLAASLDILEKNEFMQVTLSPKLLRAYLACRRAEIEHGKDCTLDDEVREAIRLA